MNKTVFLLALTILKAHLTGCSEYNKAINQSDTQKKTPLWYAVQNNNEKMVALLLKKQANPDPSYKEPSPLIAAINNRALEIVTLLLQYKANVNAADNEENTPIHAAVTQYVNRETNDFTSRDFVTSKNIVLMLLQANANIEKTNSQEETPLLLAAKANSLSLVGLILSGQNPLLNDYSSTDD